MNQLELLSSYQKYAKDIKELVVVSNTIGAIREGKKMLFVMPYDIIGNTAERKKLLDKIAKAKKKHGAKKAQLWVTGNVTSGFKSEAKSNGIKIQENILQLPYFTRK